MFCQTDCGNSIEAKSELFQKIQQNITRLLVINNYKLLCEFVKDKSEDELSGLGLSYRYQCRRNYNRQKSNLKRFLQRLLSRKESTLKGTRLNRSVVPLFNYEKCLFCQEGNEPKKIYVAPREVSGRQILHVGQTIRRKMHRPKIKNRIHRLK